MTDKFLILRNKYAKFILPILTVLMITAIILLIVNQQRVIYRQNETSAQSVANHTQTLKEINNVVIQIEKNNQINHDTTIKYLQCIVAGLISSTPQQAQATLNSCLSVSGVNQ